MRMRNLFWLALLVVLMTWCGTPAKAQPSAPSFRYTNVDPAGSCNNGTQNRYNWTNNKEWGCNNGTWVVAAGTGAAIPSGSFTSGDLPNCSNPTCTSMVDSQILALSGGIRGTSTVSTGQVSQIVPSANGSVRWLFNSQNADATKGPFNAVVGTTLFGTTEDEVLHVGYNCKNGGGNQLATDPSLCAVFEQDYQVGATHYQEIYNEFYCPAAICGTTIQSRPIFWQINKATGAMNDFEMAFNGVSYDCWPTTASVWGNMGPSGMTISGSGACGYTPADTTLAFSAPATNDLHYNLTGRGSTFSFNSTTGPTWILNVGAQVALMQWQPNAIDIGPGPNVFNGGVLNISEPLIVKDTYHLLVLRSVTGQSTSDIRLRDSLGNTIGAWALGDQNASISVNSTAVFGFGSTATGIAVDTGLSRDAVAGTIDFGTGAAGSTAGSYKATNGTLSGFSSAATYQTASNCSSSASPAVCGSSAAGSFVVAAGATTVVVNTTAVTANSQILVEFDASLGTKLGVTCNTTEPSLYGLTTRVAATSFTLSASASVTNPACFSYWIIN